MRCYAVRAVCIDSALLQRLYTTSSLSLLFLLHFLHLFPLFPRHHGRLPHQPTAPELPLARIRVKLLPVPAVQQMDGRSRRFTAFPSQYRYPCMHRWGLELEFGCTARSCTVQSSHPNMYACIDSASGFLVSEVGRMFIEKQELDSSSRRVRYAHWPSR